jgi:hypothetical protein
MGLRPQTFCHTVFSKQERQHIRQGPIETLVIVKEHVNTQI